MFVIKVFTSSFLLTRSVKMFIIKLKFNVSMKKYLFFLFLIFFSCSEKFTIKNIETFECYTELESIKKEYNNEIVTFDVCVASKGYRLKMDLNKQLTTTKDTFLIIKARKEAGKYLYPIPYPDVNFPNRCGKVRVKFTKKLKIRE